MPAATGSSLPPPRRPARFLCDFTRLARGKVTLVKLPVISFLGRTFAVEAPAPLAADIAAFFALTEPSAPASATTDRVLIREKAPGGGYSLRVNDGAAAENLTRGDIIARLVSDVAVEMPLAAGAIALKAAAVGWNEKAILIVGHERSGKSALAAWLIDKGFAYLADNSVALSAEDERLTGFPGPAAFDPARLSHLAALPTFHDSPSLRAGERMLICPGRTWLASEPSGTAGLIIDVSHQEGAALRLDPLTVEAATLRLLEATRRVVIPTDPEYAPIAAVAARTPALKLTYGHFSQLDGMLDFLARVIVETESDPADLAKFLAALPRQAPAAAPKTYPIPAKTERELYPKLTIGMATYDDFDGTYFTLQAIRMYHPEVLDDVEFVVIDNHPDGPCGEPLKHLEQSIPNYRYIPYPDAVGTAAAKERVFREAGGDFVLCMDCHVFLVPGALRRLLDYFDQNPETSDLLQGPILYDDLKTISTNYEPVWLAGFLGVWGNNPAGADIDAAPFEIAIQGLGLFACRKAAWLGFHRSFRGFGGEEGYIHEKFRRAGHRTLCLPFLRWMHRFARPMGVPFPNTWMDRVRNYLIGFREFDLPTDEMREHFREVVGTEHADELFAIVTKELDDADRRDTR
jgi:hypothetical protein